MPSWTCCSCTLINESDAIICAACASPHVSSSSWACASCTFLNNSSSSTCAICGFVSVTSVTESSSSDNHIICDDCSCLRSSVSVEPVDSGRSHTQRQLVCLDEEGINGKHSEAMIPSNCVLSVADTTNARTSCKQKKQISHLEKQAQTEAKLAKKQHDRIINEGREAQARRKKQEARIRHRRTGGKFAMQEVKVLIDNNAIAHMGGCILANLQAANIQVEITSAPIHSSIQWCYCRPTEQGGIDITPSHYTLVRMTSGEVHALFAAGKLQTMICDVLNSSNGNDVLFLLEGMHDSISSLRNQELRREIGSDHNLNKGFSSINQMDSFFLRLYLKLENGRCRFKYVKTAQEASDYVMRVTRSLAEMHYRPKLDNMNLGKIQTVPLLDAGQPKLCQTWLNFLIQIPGVSTKKAEIIMKQYPSYQSLIQAYISAPSSKEASLLLQDLASDVGDLRRLGPAISKRIHHCLWSTVTGDEAVS